MEANDKVQEEGDTNHESQKPEPDSIKEYLKIAVLYIVIIIFIIAVIISISTPPRPQTTTLEELRIEIDDGDSDELIADGEQHTITMIAYDNNGDRLKDCNISLYGPFQEAPLFLVTKKDGTCTAIVTPELSPGESNGEIVVIAEYKPNNVYWKTSEHYTILVIEG